MPKAGCTTIKRSLMRAAGGDYSNKMQFQRDVDYTFRYGHRDLKTIGPETFIFTVVRNPYSRALSAYIEKISSIADRDDRKGLSQLTEVFPDFKTVTFLDFLDFIENTQDLERDPHWRSQVELTQHDGIKKDWIGKLEQLNETINELKRRGLVLQDETMKNCNSSGSIKYSDLLEPECCRKIEKIYRDDFLAFNYAMQPEAHNYQQFPL
ncbi:MAG: sulfotransferase family protein [Bacteroidetes bacterium]|nr:sulfotransferase family protein [Bacteroidota bacterium]